MEGAQAWHVWDDRKPAPPFEFAAVCEAISDPKYIEDTGNFLFLVRGQFKVVEPVSGDVKPGFTFTLHYLIMSGEYSREAPILKGY